MSSNELASRTLGQYPLSIGTSLAIESALGIFPDNEVSPAPILEYEELWVNIKTLFRNLHGALDKSVIDTIAVDACVEGMCQEMVDIYNIVKEGTNGKTNVIYYVSNYAGIETKYPYAVIRRDSTVKQKMYTSLMNDVIKHLLKVQPEGNVQVFPLKLHPEKKTKALIITHIAYDLVAWNQFEKLTLLESHTGAFRERAQWHRRYYDGKTLTMIPFSALFLQIFGDSTLFRPMDMKIRKEVMDIATKYHWSPLTTWEKIRYGFGEIKNYYAKEILLSLPKE